MPALMTAHQVTSTIDLMGLSRDELLVHARELGMATDALAGVDGAQLSARDFGRLFMAAIRSLQHSLRNPGSAAEDVEAVLALSSYRLMFFYIIHAADLGACLNRASTYYRRFEKQQRSFRLVTTGSSVRWHFDLGPMEPLELPIPQHFSMQELHWLPGLSGRMMAIYLWHRTASWLTGCFMDLEGVYFDCEPVGEIATYGEAFGAPVFFNQDWCGMAFHRRYLQLPIVQDEQSVERMLETFPALLIEADELDASMAARVRGLLGDQFVAGLPTLDDVATRLFTTPATLHRRLQEEGTSFQKLKDQCRRDTAMSMLRAGQYSGADIAEFLRFSDPSSFFRAFKKWTGMTPQEFKSRKA